MLRRQISLLGIFGVIAVIYVSEQSSLIATSVLAHARMFTPDSEPAPIIIKLEDVHKSGLPEVKRRKLKESMPNILAEYDRVLEMNGLMARALKDMTTKLHDARAHADAVERGPSLLSGKAFAKQVFELETRITKLVNGTAAVDSEVAARVEATELMELLLDLERDYSALKLNVNDSSRLS